MTEYKGVMVYAEVTDGKLAAITVELLGCGRKLADELGEELIATLIGRTVSNLAPEAITFGADKVYTVEDQLLEDYQTDAYLPVMARLTGEVMPQIILLGQTEIGRDLAPRLAFRLETAATLDCVDLAIDMESKWLRQTKPVYGGNARAVFLTESRPQVATVRAKAMSPPERNTARKGEVIPFTAGLEPAAIRTRVLEKVPQAVAEIRLEDAEVIVSGGRGIGNAEGFQQLAKLAGLFKGAVGASRPAIDNGWVPDVSQVGLTGKIVTPELYIAIALSGASQHMAGCSGSKNIIAINKSPEANIFREARFGVVGDWEKVLPAFTDKVRELLTE
ncbi:MAG: electron transfer flavoprotein subunit alpha/FixB family protein [Dehalococcoidales bacterium]|nr:electron transfer flavoprotein subunit alpha/FixB family protein [Dehalococcoidales bacterium]MDP7286214.1 electron transfer flavoprotein subunit alpha/FixB family protein [Dehalococcoidales bacterium]MDP7415721.1 electron transfer flavoprotein subunit alpha/FixB family protein [Dehalococcoidales bacterium]